jgi:hypothetical protein
MAAATHRVSIKCIRARTYVSVYDIQQRNPGPSGNDDLDASELFAGQVEDKDKDDYEEPHGVEIIDDQVGFSFLSPQKRQLTPMNFRFLSR